MTIDEKDLYVEDYKTLLSKIKEGVYILWFWFGRLKVVKLSSLLKQIQHNLPQIPLVFFFFNRN